MDFNLFPYILARVAGLPFDLMDVLSWSEKQQLEEHLEAAEAIEEERNEILSALLKVVEVIEDYPAKFYLKILRRDIFNRRSIKIKPFQYQGVLEKEFYEVIEMVKVYRSNVEQWRLRQVSFSDFYTTEINRGRALLQENELPEALTKGLQLGSHSFLDRLESYQQKGRETMNKKLFQTERKLLQYLSRMATKTSPFSSFTLLAIIDFEGKMAGQYLRKIRLNNSLFQLFRDALIHYRPFFKTLNLRLNPAHRKALNPTQENQNGEWIFLLNTRNIESVQQLDSDDLIDFLVEVLTESKANYSFWELVNLLAENVEAETSAVENYILQLIDYGFLEWDWPFSGLDPYWFIRLRALLENHRQDPLLEQLWKVLRELEDWMSLFESGDLAERNMAQQKSFNALKKISEELLEATALKDAEQVVSSDQLKNIFASGFRLSPEQVFYEDVSQAANTPFDQEDFEVCGLELDRLTRLLSHLYYNSSKEKYQSFFKANYPEGRISLLRFYEAYFREPRRESPPIEEKEMERRAAYFYQIIKNGSYLNEAHFHLNWDDFPETKISPDEHPAKGTLLQMYRSEGVTKAFVDAAFMGYGKMFGRFLHLFPETLTEAIQRHNSAIPRDCLWVENVDASIYNPNVHPPLLAFEIQMPGSQNNLQKAEQIAISDLEICWNEAKDKLILWHKNQDKRVVIFDYGFEAISNRSPMYQLLASFNYQLVGPHILSDLLDNELVRKDEQGIIHRPRISVGEHLVIRRRGWGIPKNLLPVKINAMSDADYFLRVNQWRKALKIPASVFITINSPDFETAQKERSKSDDYKPQYIDFSSPLFVLLFAKLIVKTPSFLKIEEMLPEGNVGACVQEFLLEVRS